MYLRCQLFAVKDLPSATRKRAMNSISISLQGRGAWLNKQGKGKVVYFMPGHAASDFENDNYAQMILNAITWKTH